MPEIHLASLAAGALSCAVALGLAVVLVFGTFRLHAAILTSRHDGEAMLLSGHRSLAIALGATLLSQSILLRHAVYPTMAVVRDLFLGHPSAAEVWRVVGQCALFWVVLAVAAIGSVLLAAWLFTRLTGRLPEQEEILKDNVAVAIFYAFVLLAITMVLNEGIEDLSRSLVPYGPTGVIELP